MSLPETTNVLPLGLKIADFSKEINNGTIVLENNGILAKAPLLPEESWRRTAPDLFFLPAEEVVNFAGKPVLEQPADKSQPWKVKYEKFALPEYSEPTSEITNNAKLNSWLNDFAQTLSASLPPQVVTLIKDSVFTQKYSQIAVVSICQSEVKITEFGSSVCEAAAVPNTATTVTTYDPGNIQLALAQRLSVCVPYKLRIGLSQADLVNKNTALPNVANTAGNSTLVVLLDSLQPAFNQSYSHTEIVVEKGEVDLLTISGGAGQCHLRHEIKISAGAKLNQAWLAVGTNAQSAHAQLLERRIEVADTGTFNDAVVLSSQGKLRVISNLAMLGPQALANCSSTLLATKGNIDYEPIHEHIGSHAESHLKSKTLAWGRARAVFQGLVKVPESGTGAIASQINKNLLLSPKARIDALPRLEIIPNEVSCKHGSAAGEIDNRQIYYLCTRGFSPEQAKNLVIKSFAQEGLSGLNIDSWLYDIAESLVDAIVSHAEN